MWIAAAKLFIAILGTYLLARSLALRRAPAAVAALGYGASPYIVVWLQHPHTNSYILLPWMMLAARRLALNRRPVDAAGLAAVLGLTLLGGHPQSAVLSALPAFALLLFEALQRRDGSRPSGADLLRIAGLTAGACALGAGVAAITLLPFAEALGQSDMLSRATTAPSPVGLIAVLAPT